MKRISTKQLIALEAQKRETSKVPRETSEPVATLTESSAPKR
jgi:hypothetical protein